MRQTGKENGTGVGGRMEVLFVIMRCLLYIQMDVKQAD